MKKWVLIGALLGFAAPLWAQSTRAWLDAFSAQIAASPAVEAGFSVNGQLQGSMVLQGACFSLSMDEIRMYSNGKQKWSYNSGLQEVTPLPFDPQSADIIENPPAFFSRMTTDFTFEQTPTTSQGRDGETQYHVVLIPKESVALPFERVELVFTAKRPAPVQVQCALADGNELFITITSFQVCEPFPASYFE